MAARYRVIKTADPRRVFPVEALRLVEDIQALESAMALLRSVDLWNISPDHELGEEMWRATILQVRSWHRYARQKLQQDYLKY